MSGLMHTTVELYACGQFGTVTKLQTEESASCSSRVETTSVTLRLIGSDSYGISLKRVAAASSSEQPCICTTTVIEAVAPHSAAFHSGRIQPNDRLIAVNGRSTSALTIDEIYENMEGGDGATDLMIEFDVYETSVTPSSIVAVRLIKRSSVLGIEFRAGSGRKEDPIVVKSVLPASVAHRSGAIEAGDEFLMIDDVPLSGCTVQESLRLLQTSHDFVKLHIRKSGGSNETRPTERQESPFRFSVDLHLKGEQLGLVIGEQNEVVSIQKDGLCWRTGAVAIGDRLVSINGEVVENRPPADVQRRLSEPTQSMTLSLARRLHSGDRQRTPLQGEDGTWGLQNERKLTVPLMNRLHLVDIHKVITDLTASYQHQELQALRAFEKVEDHLLNGKQALQRPSVEIQTPLRIGQRLSSDSFSSSGFGSVSAVSQQSAPETPSCSCAAGGSALNTSICSPISIFDPNTKNVLLLRDAEQQGFGFSISESEEGAVFVSGVKAGGMAEQNGICAGDRILQVSRLFVLLTSESFQVNNVNAVGASCAQLLPLFNTDFLELVLCSEETAESAKCVL
ncbi:Glutamate receptor-interacting protein 1 [Aphelenchoides fujianensis]|nr:Glutamate receptor-interacting protein 1 [Aphelenchoides fujianensis]